MAYVLPGFVTLLGLSLFTEDVGHWIGANTETESTVGGFLYVTLASVGLGLFVSSVRWLSIDRIHVLTGVPARNWNYRQIRDSIEGFEFLVQNQYRYYQYHANCFVAVGFYSLAWCVRHGLPSIWLLTAVAAIQTVLWLGSRDTLRNYHIRVEELLGPKSPLRQTDDQKAILIKKRHSVGSSSAADNSCADQVRNLPRRRPLSNAAPSKANRTI